MLSNLIELPVEEKIARGLLYTPNEIAQQPTTWNQTFWTFDEQREQLILFLDQVGIHNSQNERPIVVLIGAGTSDYVGRALIALLREKWECEVVACASTELLPNLDTFVVSGRKYLWISFSRSGNSPEGVAVLEKAIRLYPEIAHLVVTCNMDAQMIPIVAVSRNSHILLLNDMVNDRGLAMTSSFTNMIVMGQCLAHAWSIEEYRATLDILIVAGHQFLESAARHAERISAKHYARMCMVGSGALAAVAKESALKVLEMTSGQIKTMSETVLGLRHGPMAALDTETLFVCFASEKRNIALYAADLLCEIKQKGIVAELVVVGPSWAKSEFICDSYLELPDEVGDAYRPILDVIFGQLLGLYCSIEHELKPDVPSPGGVINRVVEHFQIY